MKKRTIWIFKAHGNGANCMRREKIDFSGIYYATLWALIMTLVSEIMHKRI